MTTKDGDLTATLLEYINRHVAATDTVVERHTDLLVTGAVDSLGVVRITQFMEDTLDTEVDPLDVTLDNFQTVNQMIDFVLRQRAAK